MRGSLTCVAVLLLGLCTDAVAAPFVFNTDPFAGSTALTTPGRQIIAGEPSISFSITDDVFVFDSNVFGVSGIDFINTNAAGIPASGVNTVVLQEFGPPMAAGLAANLIAAQITTAGAGFFVYFNTGLNLPRLVYSTDLSSPDADLKILARLTNLSGNQAAMAQFTESNFAVVPEPAGILLMTTAASMWAVRKRRQKRER
jgi:hypothetical protein